MSHDTIPVCPHCDYRLPTRLVWEGSDFDTSDGARNETVCPCCEETFITDVYAVTHFNTRPKLKK
jgi:hypothetical protein